jgi:hypothetical protein
MDRLTRYEGSVLERYSLLIESTGASYSPSGHGTSLEQRIRSFSEVNDTPRLTALLQRILVLEPLQRPDVSDILNDPWFTGSSSPGTSGSGSE